MEDVAGLNVMDCADEGLVVGPECQAVTAREHCQWAHRVETRGEPGHAVPAGDEVVLECLAGALGQSIEVITRIAKLTKAGAQCTPANARGIGQTKTQTFMEVACQEGSGYIVIASAPFDGAKGIQAQNCLNYDDAAGNIKCTLTDKSARLAVVEPRGGHGAAGVSWTVIIVVAIGVPHRSLVGFGRVQGRGNAVRRVVSDVVLESNFYKVFYI